MAENVDRKPKEASAQMQLPTQTEDLSGSVLLKNAREVMSEWKDVIAKREAILDREERLAAERMLGGRAIAGQPPEQPKVETPQEYAKKVLAGGK